MAGMMGIGLGQLSQNSHWLCSNPQLSELLCKGNHLKISNRSLSGPVDWACSPDVPTFHGCFKGIYSGGWWHCSLGRLRCSGCTWNMDSQLSQWYQWRSLQASSFANRAGLQLDWVHLWRSSSFACTAHQTSTIHSMQLVFLQQIPMQDSSYI